jgi:hypothetical protein
MRDLRKYAKQTNVRLVVGFLLILLIVGDGLIYLFYGPYSAAMGFVCIGLGLLPVAMIFIILWILDWVVKRTNGD